jgi:hypothetical protein
VTRSVRSNYHRFRRAGWRADEAIRAARILERWDEAKGEGWVRIQVEPDDSGWHHDDICGCDRGDKCQVLRAAIDNGVYAVIGEYRDDPDAPEDDRWMPGDSVCGFVGYDDPLDPYLNPYVLDIMATTLDALDAQAIAPGL